MSDVQEEILALLPRLWKLYPDMRFGQLVVNVSYWASPSCFVTGSTGKTATWDVEDIAFLETMKKHVEKREQELRGS